jgi:hypothetical protein
MCSYNAFSLQKNTIRNTFSSIVSTLLLVHPLIKEEISKYQDVASYKASRCFKYNRLQYKVQYRQRKKLVLRSPLFSYRNWRNEPDNYDEQDCCAINSYGLLSDEYCKSKLGFICSYPIKRGTYYLNNPIK